MAKKTARSATNVRAPRDTTAWRKVDRIQLATVLGVHPDTVTDWTRAGMPVLVQGGAGQRSLYDLPDVMQWWRGQQGLDDKEKQQARAYKAQAEMNELKIQRERGQLVRRDQVVREGAAYTKGWTAMIRTLPRRLRIEGVITRELELKAVELCREVLSEIARWQSIEDVEASAKAAEALPE